MTYQPLLKVCGTVLPMGYEDVVEYLEWLKVGHVLPKEPWLLLVEELPVKENDETTVFRVWMKRTRSNWIVEIRYPFGELGRSPLDGRMGRIRGYGYDLDGEIAHYRKEVG